MSTDQILTCPKCGQRTLKRDESKRRIYYVCTNLYCSSNSKSGKHIGKVRVQ